MSPNTIFIHEKQNIYIKISTFIKKKITGLRKQGTN